MRIKILYFLILSVLLYSCNSEDKQEQKDLPVTPLAFYIHDNYSISYPIDWVLDKHDTTATQFVLYAPDFDSVKQIKHNINLVTQDLTKSPMNTREFLNYSLQQLKILLQDSKVIKSEMMKIGTDSVGHMIHTASADGIVLSFDQFFWVRNKRAYLLSLTSTEDWFQKNQQRGEEIMKSFQLR